MFLTLSQHISCSASYPLKIGVITDVHYLSESLMDSSDIVTKYETRTGRNIIEAPAILDQAVTDYVKSDIDMLFIAGDMTKDGEKQSHIDFAKKLKPLTDRGIRIFVVPGNHDINVPHAVSLKNNQAQPTEKTSPSDFEDIYAACGYNEAIKRDTASLSYVAEINEEVWLLAIDACLYKEYKDSSISNGKITWDTEQWIIKALQEAKDKNIRVISMMHHGLVEHFIYQSQIFAQYLVYDWHRLANLFADNGVEIIFTGHFHANDITLFTSKNGNKIYDIETGSLSAYPFAYRFIELSETGIKITTKNITSTPAKPDLVTYSTENLHKIALKLAREKVLSKKADLPEDIVTQIAEIAADLFILHIEGDEVVNETLKNKIKEVAEALDFPIDISPENFQIDFPPADNNIEIRFQEKK